MKTNVKQVLLVGIMFASSIFIGNSLFPDTINATEPPPKLSPKELPFLQLPLVTQEKPPVENIEVVIDVANNDVTVNGAQNARVNVTTTNFPKEKIKYVTRYKTINAGRPETKVMENHINTLMQTPKESFSGR